MEPAAELALKAAVLVEGLRVDESAVEGVGARYHEDISAVFGYYIERVGPSTVFPADFKLPGGTVVKVCYNSHSPYLARKEDGELRLEKNGRPLSPIGWVERPRYYERTTFDGVPMARIAPIRGECALRICNTVACINWRDGLQCRYCNMNAAQQIRPGTVELRKTPQQFGEVASAALEEGIHFHTVLSGGFLPGNRTEDDFVAILGAIREQTGLQGRLPAMVNLRAPLDLSQIDRLHEAGASCIALDLEVWHPAMFPAICPGKARRVGRENWLRALEYAVEIFGAGKVYSAFVLGLEEKEAYLAAAEYLVPRGIFPLLVPWVVMAGSKLEGHRAPHPEWMLEVNERVVDILAEGLPRVLTEEFLRKEAYACYRCGSNVLVWDEIRRRIGGFEIIMEKEKAPLSAIKGS
jgi:hypothetical protein